LGPGTQPQLQDQFADPAKVALHLTQNNNTLNIMDGQTLEQARAALEEVKRIKDAGRKATEENKQLNVSGRSGDG
jgi:hypothetical protein